MATARKKADASFVAELFKTELYKRNAGKLTRQLTALGMGLVAAFGCYALSGQFTGQSTPVRIGIPLALFAVAAWAIFRAINFPRFADFLISVDAEMDKVTWASRGEVYRATIVVLGVMIFMLVSLSFFDIFWIWLFRLINFIEF